MTMKNYVAALFSSLEQAESGIRTLQDVKPHRWYGSVGSPDRKYFLYAIFSMHRITHNPLRN